MRENSWVASWSVCQNAEGSYCSKITYSDLSDRVHHMKITIKKKEGCEERDVWPIRNRSLDLYRIGHMGWLEKLKFHVEMNPKKKPNVIEMEVAKMAEEDGRT